MISTCKQTCDPSYWVSLFIYFNVGDLGVYNILLSPLLIIFVRFSVLVCISTCLSTPYSFTYIREVIYPQGGYSFKLFLHLLFIQNTPSALGDYSHEIIIYIHLLITPPPFFICLIYSVAKEGGLRPVLLVELV